MKALVLSFTLLVAACAHQKDTTPYENGVVPPSPTHCCDVACAADEYCRANGNKVQCVSIPVIAL
jgi:hypothetical protein